MRDRRGRELGFSQGKRRVKKAFLRELGIKRDVSRLFNPQFSEQSNNIWYELGSWPLKKSLQWGLKCFFCAVSSPFLAFYEARSTNKLRFWGLNYVF